jgi:hypothetical protein
MRNQGEAIMQSIITVITALHVLSSVFWAGSTFTLAHTGGVQAEHLFRPQIGAATVAVITGAALWHYLHEGSVGISEQILATGAACAIIAAGIQGISTGSALRRAGPVNSAQALRSIAIGQRAAGVLLATTFDSPSRKTARS